MGDHGKLLRQSEGIMGNSLSRVEGVGDSPASVGIMRNSWASAGDLVRLVGEGISGLNLEG